MFIVLILKIFFGFIRLYNQKIILIENYYLCFDFCKYCTFLNSYFTEVPIYELKNYQVKKEYIKPKLHSIVIRTKDELYKIFEPSILLSKSEKIKGHY